MQKSLQLCERTRVQTNVLERKNAAQTRSRIRRRRRRWRRRDTIPAGAAANENEGENGLFYVFVVVVVLFSGALKAINFCLLPEQALLYLLQQPPRLEHSLCTFAIVVILQMGNETNRAKRHFHITAWLAHSIQDEGEAVAEIELESERASRHRIDYKFKFCGRTARPETKSEASASVAGCKRGNATLQPRRRKILEM